MEACDEYVTSLGLTTPVSYFPAFLDDELLYSTVARYHWAAGNADAMRTKKRFFASGSLPTVLPGNLDHFAARFPVGAVSVDRLIERHTIFPYFAPFLSTQRAARTLSSMRCASGHAVKASLGIVGSRIKDVCYLRLCIDCVTEQRASGLQPYWRRVHQLPGVEHCPIHGSPLIDRCVQCGPFNHRNTALLLPDTACSHCGNHYASATPPLDGSDLGVSVARFVGLSANLLSANLPVLPPRLRASVYAEALDDLGIDARKPVLSGVLPARLRAYWGEALLQKLGIANHPRLAMSEHMFHDTEMTAHPALHLLLVGFLFGSVEAFAARLRPQAQFIGQAALVHLGMKEPDPLIVL